MTRTKDPLKIVVAPNAFKGALSAPQAAQAMGRGLTRSGLACDIDLMPVADGGDDTLEVLLARGGEVRTFTVRDPLGRPVEAELGIMPDGVTGVVEMARPSGLKLLKPAEYDPLRANTYGTGELIAKAVEAGCSRIIVGVGGSATVDGGVGCAQALGAHFLDEAGREVKPHPGLYDRIARIDLEEVLPGLDRVAIEVACDVENPVVGDKGAPAVFGPQKGADPEMVKLLDRNLDHLFALAAAAGRPDVRHLPRAGGAGALSGGLMAFFGARIGSGIELILDHIQARERLKGADLALTGEGRIDFQTLHGKGPMGLALAAKAQGVPVVALAGSVGSGLEGLEEAGIVAVLPIWSGPLSLEEAMAATAELLEETSARVGRLLKLGQNLGRTE